MNFCTFTLIYYETKVFYIHFSGLKRAVINVYDEMNFWYTRMVFTSPLGAWGGINKSWMGDNNLPQTPTASRLIGKGALRVQWWFFFYVNTKFWNTRMVLTPPWGGLGASLTPTLGICRKYMSVRPRNFTHVTKVCIRESA